MIFTKNKKFKKVLEYLEKFKNNIPTVPLLLGGETGTGKEVCCAFLKDPKKPFVALDASTLQCEMAESILFGYEKGVFTGAYQTTPGLLEQACGGIFFLDEVQNLSLSIQAKLLRVIQEKEVRRLGGKVPRPLLDLQWVVATNENLEALCARGKFRMDLLQRLQAFSLWLPPLRERLEDFWDLLEYFNKGSLVFQKETGELLEKYSWPGNIRELQNVIQGLKILHPEGSVIQPEDLPERIQRFLKSPWERDPLDVRPECF